ncbi:aspartyl-tRNA synthetase, putative [Schistosoma mansoni]|nr:aspartyl-tRNA synthetase, putative [Schistosoma mansoni]|eukprot:XP_018644319.1 aspartyl-tRNA synthetase, putative [Schistosoma mansoni]
MAKAMNARQASLYDARDKVSRHGWRFE